MTLREIVDDVELQRVAVLKNKVSSSLKQVQQGFDNQTQEHVYWFEYRVRLRNDPPPRPNPRLVKAAKDRKMSLLRDLLSQV